MATVQIQLLKQIGIKGKTFRPGDIVDVPERLAAELLGANRAKPAPAAPAPKPVDRKAEIAKLSLKELKRLADDLGLDATKPVNELRDAVIAAVEERVAAGE